MTEDEKKSVVDSLWKMYQESCTQARHHEIQRSSITAATLVISAAILGIVTLDKGLLPNDLPQTFFLIILGGFSATFSLKYHERFSLYMERARKYRDAIDEQLPGCPLVTAKKRADIVHGMAFPRLENWHLHNWWVALNLVVSLIGIVLTIVVKWFPVAPNC